MGEELASVRAIVNVLERADFALRGGWEDSSEHWRYELLEDLKDAGERVTALGSVRSAIDSLDADGLPSSGERRAAFTVVAIEREQQVGGFAGFAYAPLDYDDRMQSVVVALGGAAKTCVRIEDGDENADRDLLLDVVKLGAVALEWVEEVLRRGALTEAGSQLRAPVCAYCGLGFVGEPEVEDLEVGGGYAHRACMPAVRP